MAFEVAAFRCDVGRAIGVARARGNNCASGAIRIVETFRKYPNIPTVVGCVSIGSDIPDFVKPNILTGEWPGGAPKSEEAKSDQKKKEKQ